MSDGMTDAYRDAERARSIEDLHKLEIDFLKSPTNQGILVIKKRWGHRQSERVELLQRAATREATDEEWAQLLAGTPDDDIYNLRRKMQKLSPFADKLLVMADYGSGFYKSTKGAIEQEISKYLNDVKNWMTYDCDKFLVVLDKPNIQDAYWTGCGIIQPRQEGPRPHRK